MTPLSRYVVETLVTLTAVVALSVVLLAVLRRAGVGKPAGPLELVARLPLDGRRAVYLVRAGETVYVLAAAEGALQKLGELPESALPRGPAIEHKTFREVLKQALGLPGEASRGRKLAGGANADPPLGAPRSGPATEAGDKA